MYSLIAYDGQVYGPVDVRTLIAWCQQGRIVANSHLVETQTGRSFLAGDMPELAAVLAQSQPPSPQSFPQPQQSPGGFQVSQQPYNPGQIQPQNPYQAYPRAGTHVPPQQYQGQFPSSPVDYGVYGQPKSRGTALLLCFILGGLGAHRFYLGHTKSGIAMLVVGLLGCASAYFLVIILIWSTVDFFRIMSGSMLDSRGIAPR